MKVFGMGEQKTPSAFRAACDQVYLYRDPGSASGVTQQENKNDKAET